MRTLCSWAKILRNITSRLARQKIWKNYAWCTCSMRRKTTSLTVLPVCQIKLGYFFNFLWPSQNICTLREITCYKIILPIWNHSFTWGTFWPVTSGIFWCMLDENIHSQLLVFISLLWWKFFQRLQFNEGSRCGAESPIGLRQIKCD